jgi:ABC-type sulfate transport system substrate-binding protein
VNKFWRSALLAAAFGAIALLIPLYPVPAQAQAQSQSAPASLLNVSYDVAREFYKDSTPPSWPSHKKATGKDIKVDQSHAGSSAQARAVNDGLDADVVTMNTTTDVEFLASKGVVAKDWRQNGSRTTPRPPRPPCCSWCATATPRASRTGTTSSSPACR